MPIILIPIFIIIIIAGFSIGGDVFRDISFDLPNLNLIEKRFGTTPQKQTSTIRTTSTSSQSTTASFILDTEITKGPAQGEVISDTNTVVFEFGGSITPEDRVRITFETRVFGVDSYWRPTSSNKRTIKLPAGPRQYTFEVRAKYKGERDSTPASRTFTINTSSDYGKVDISSARQATSSRAFLITLKTKLASGEEINITGWRVEGELGGFDIPLGIEKIASAINLTPRNNITVQRGDIIYLSGEKSPFGQKISFRPNTCIGYLRQYYTFPLSVSSSCPDKPTERDLRYMKKSCQDFILQDIKLSSCTIPSHANNAAVATDTECLAYIENHFNYNACYNLHKNDSNFTKNQWHIYMERDFTRDRYDTIRLLDQDGRVVDTLLR